jgi:hypothetical protein
MSNYITSFDNFCVPDEYLGAIYAPDITFERRSNSHTMRKCNMHTMREYSVEITRPQYTGSENGVYVTEMDEHLDSKAFNHGYNNLPVTIALHKNELYEQFIFDIEENCVEKSTTYDKFSNMNKTKYKVPVIGVLVGITHQSSYAPQNIAFDDEKEELQKFIMIRGKIYPIGKYFRENGLEYSEIHLPENYFSKKSVCEDGETSYYPQKTSFLKDILTYSFHHDMKISSVVIRPELMKFKQVSSDNRMSRYDRANPSILRKKKYHINVLENDPGFMSKFELSYRSEQTNGQWVKHGIFNGNVSNIDFTKISFDEITAKEIRIVPLSFHKSYEHIQVTFIGKCKVQSKSEELFVTYEVSIPRDGKYMKYSSKNCDSNVNNTENRDWKQWKVKDKKRELLNEIRERIAYDS